MKCIGWVICILHSDSKGFEKCRKRIMGLISKRAKISSVLLSINLEEPHRNQTKISALEVTWSADGWGRSRPWWCALTGCVALRTGVLMHGEMETVGCLPGEGAVNQYRRWFKVKSLLRLPSTLGAFNWALRHRSVHFAPRKKSYTISPLQCRGMRGRN